MSLFEALKADAPEWEDYTRHEFVEQLGDGKLPIEAFQDYLVQDYIFLLHFARAHALAAFKSRTFAEIKDVTEALGGLLHETTLHRAFMKEWGITDEQAENTPEKQGTVAYTRYVLDTGLAGDLLELQVALAPCKIGYAEIGAYLKPRLDSNADHPYRDWIDMYASDEFKQLGDASIAALDQLAEFPMEQLKGTPRYERLLDIFRKASRLEADFWQQALDALNQPAR